MLLFLISSQYCGFKFCVFLCLCLVVEQMYEGKLQRWAVPSTKVPRYFFSTGTDGTFSKMVPKYRYRGTFFKKVFGIFSFFLSLVN